MVLTPSSTSSAIAGGGYWAVMWSCLFKANHMPGLKSIVPRDRILNWISGHKIEALIITEVANISTHSGVLGVTFALGGTVVNTIVIMVIFPIRALFMKRSRNQILKGVHA
jgi:hypothetical protein